MTHAGKCLLADGWKYVKKFKATNITLLDLSADWCQFIRPRWNSTSNSQVETAMAQISAPKRQANRSLEHGLACLWSQWLPTCMNGISWLNPKLHTNFPCDSVDSHWSNGFKHEFQVCIHSELVGEVFSEYPMNPSKDESWSPRQGVALHAAPQPQPMPTLTPGTRLRVEDREICSTENYKECVKSLWNMSTTLFLAGSNLRFQFAVLFLVIQFYHLTRFAPDTRM